MPQVALLNVLGLVINSHTIVEKPTANRKNNTKAQAANKKTKLFCVKVVASRYSSLIKIKGFV